MAGPISNDSSNFFNLSIEGLHNEIETKEKEENLFYQISDSTDNAIFEMREFLGIGGDYETFVQHKEQEAESGLEAFSSTYNNFPEKSLLLDSSESIESKIFLFQEEIEKTNNWEEDTEKTLNSFFNTDE